VGSTPSVRLESKAEAEVEEEVEVDLEVQLFARVREETNDGDDGRRPVCTVFRLVT
jgi:hypothetical protein